MCKRKNKQLRNRRNCLIFKSGKRDSNPRPSAWEADALPLSYSRIACRFSMEKLRKQDKSNKKTVNLQLVSHFYGASPEKKIGIDRMVLSCCTVPAGRIRLSTHNFCTMSRSVETGREKTAVPVRGAVAPPDRVWQASPVNQTGTNRNDPSPYFGKGGFIPPVFSAKRGSVRCRDVFLRECKAHPAGRGSAPLPCCERPSSCC